MSDPALREPGLVVRTLRISRATFPVAVACGVLSGLLVATGLYGPQTARWYVTCALVWVISVLVNTAGTTIALRRILKATRR